MTTTRAASVRWVRVAGAAVVIVTLFVLGIVAMSSPDDTGDAQIVQLSWESAKVSSDGMTLRVEYARKACQRFTEAHVTESDSAVRVDVLAEETGVSSEEGVHCDDDIGISENTIVNLSDELGGREVTGCNAGNRDAPCPVE